jgi:hypothetical protein
MKNRILHIALFVLSFSALLDAQTVILKAPRIEAGENQQYVDIDVRVDSFIQVAGAQFTLRWNPAVLVYEEVRNFGLDDMTQENFGRTDVDSGLLTFYWYDQSARGVTVDNNHELFTLKVRVVGALNSFTNIDFIDVPTAIEISDTSNHVMTHKLVNGVVSIGKLSADEEVVVPRERLTISPNPFKDQTTLQFHLAKAADAQLSIFNTESKLVYQNTLRLVSGGQKVTLSKDMLPASGSYFLTLKTKEFTETRKLIFTQ